ncbi:MAG: biliverdin-producing heme oxygenase [Cellvibrio sp.]|uniref:biliverdin-producing heme oxygenase n=1 Tax=Cellvibrio sp. TaxID=1965322 RepID=UPI0031A9BC48
MTLAPIAVPIVHESLRQRLRQETDDIHQLLHRESNMSKLMSEDCTKEDYLHVLQVFFQFYNRTEPFFDGIPALQRFNHEVKPLEWLKKDFIALAKPLPEPDFLFEELSHKYVIAQTVESYLGYLYVKQGSTLGGQVISKQLRKLGLMPGESQFFFNGAGSSSGDHWKEFLAFLAQCEPHVNADSVVSSARTHFLILHHFFTQSFASGGDNGPR